MLQAIVFETNRYSLQRFGEGMRVPCTTKELEKYIGCYFWMGFAKMPDQRIFWEKDLSHTGFYQSSQEIGLKHSFELFMW